MLGWSRLWSRVADTSGLLEAIAALGPGARAWAERQSVALLSRESLCQLGRSALDGMTLCEAFAASTLILSAIHGLRKLSNSSLLAGAGLALVGSGRESSLARNLFKTFEAIEQVSPDSTPISVLAALGSRLTVSDVRLVLAYMAGLRQLDVKSRELAREATDQDAPHPKLVFDALLGCLPDTLSANCSPALREDLLVLRLMTQDRPAPTLWQRLFAAPALASRAT